MALHDRKQYYETKELRVDIERDRIVRMVHVVGGYIKSVTVSFSQAMPVIAMQRAEAGRLARDLFVAIGSIGPADSPNWPSAIAQH